MLSPIRLRRCFKCNWQIPALHRCIPAWVSLEEALERGIEQALYKKKSPEDALQMIDNECALILRKYAR